MDRTEAARPLNPFERFVSAIANVPKAEVDAEQAKHDAKPRIKPGRKAKAKPAA